MVQHFQIALHVVRDLLLLHADTAEVVKTDQDLTTSSRYFLAFVRIGSEFPQGSVSNQMGSQFPLLEKRLFRRVSAIITIKVGVLLGKWVGR